jgi:hypothetical protein
MRRFTIVIGVLLASMFHLSPALADYCSICVKDYCQTTYRTDNDGDGDGMNDDYEMQLAIQYKPTLYLDFPGSDRPFRMPDYYARPPYSYESGVNHGLPSDIVSDTTVYVHVRPYGVVGPGKAHYIEIAYWFYYTYSQAECQQGYTAEHGHDWEHIALALSIPPESSTRGESFLATN